MEWIIGGLVLFFIGKKLTKKNNNSDYGNSDYGKEFDKDFANASNQSSGLFIDLEKMLKNNRIKALKKETALIEKRIAMEQALINKMESLASKKEKTPVEHIAEAKAKADMLSMEIVKSTGRKKKDLEFKLSQEVENQKYWIRQILA